MQEEEEEAEEDLEEELLEDVFCKKRFLRIYIILIVHNKQTNTKRKGNTFTCTYLCLQSILEAFWQQMKKKLSRNHFQTHANIQN